MKSRDAAIDTVRVVGISAIVAGHVWESQITWLWLYPWHVPIFFFLSGYLWRNSRSVSSELAARSRTLLKPYLFWFVVIFALWAWALVRAGEMTIEAILTPLYGGFYSGRPFTTFWFVFVLFAGAVAYRIVQTLPVWARVSLVVLALASSVFAGELLARTPLAIGSALPALTFIAAGHLLRWARERCRFSGWGWVGAASLAIGLALATTGVAAPLNIKQGDWGTPVLSVVNACLLSGGLVLAAQVVASRIHSPTVHAAITAAALTGFTVVLVHPLVLWALRADPRHGDLLIYAIAIAVPAVLASIALRTRLSQWVTGIPQINRTQVAVAR